MRGWMRAGANKMRLGRRRRLNKKPTQIEQNSFICIPRRALRLPTMSKATFCQKLSILGCIFLVSGSPQPQYSPPKSTALPRPPPQHRDLTLISPLRAHRPAGWEQGLVGIVFQSSSVLYVEGLESVEQVRWLGEGGESRSLCREGGEDLLMEYLIPLVML